jgi:hypothetical protein
MVNQNRIELSPYLVLNPFIRYWVIVVETTTILADTIYHFCIIVVV